MNSALYKYVLLLLYGLIIDEPTAHVPKPKWKLANKDHIVYSVHVYTVLIRSHSVKSAFHI